MALTEAEKSIIYILADAFMAFGKLDAYHPDDSDAFASHTHILQQMVMARVAVREHQDLFHKIPKSREEEQGDE